MSTKAEQAIAFHDKGYNCAQAVACSFCKEFGVDEEEMFRIAEGFGLGMGMMEVCGALSGMMMIIGLQNSVGNLDKGKATKGDTYKKVREYAAKEESEVFVVCAEIEAEISELDDDEKKMFLEDLGLTESGLEKLIKASYKLLGLISYLTAGEPEVRAWTITEGTKAPQAAGKIHSDFERGFIRAEVVSYDDLIACGSHAAAKEKGLIRLEGKEYVVKDGDIMLFRFNV